MEGDWLLPGNQNKKEGYQLTFDDDKGNDGRVRKRQIPSDSVVPAPR